MFLFEIGQKVLFTNTDDGEPVEVEITGQYENPSGACGDPKCCGTKDDYYDILLSDGSTEYTSEIWLTNV